MEARGVPHAVRFLDWGFQVLDCGSPALVIEMEAYDSR